MSMVALLPAAGLSRQLLYAAGQQGLLPPSGTAAGTERVGGARAAGGGVAADVQR
jgi:hypothetical protein